MNPFTICEDRQLSERATRELSRLGFVLTIDGAKCVTLMIQDIAKIHGKDQLIEFMRDNDNWDYMRATAQNGAIISRIPETTN